jgi:SRSO17 transposase
MWKARVPAERQSFRTKPEIAIEEVDRIRGAGVQFGCVLADAGYGLSAPFRQALSARSLRWAVGIPFKQKVYPADVALVFPVLGRGRPRKRHIPDSKSVAAETMLADASWRLLTWRRGTKGRLAARFAAIRVRVADGPPQRIRDMGAQHMPGEEVWLIGEHRSNGERKYYLSNLPSDTPLKVLAGTIKARWVCEQAHQQLKEELGLDHFEGRSWTGLHRHALMTMIAYAFLQSRRLKQVGGGKKNHRPSTATDPAGGPSGDHQLSHQAISTAMSALLQATQSPATQSAKVVLGSATNRTRGKGWRAGMTATSRI